MISLEKRTEDAHTSLVSLLKKEQSRGIDLGELSARVELVIDYSGSMKKRLRVGSDGRPSEVQTVVDRALALALSGLDDDGIVPVRFFQDFVFDAVQITTENYTGFVDHWTARHKTGGTNFVPAMAAVLDAPVRKRKLAERLKLRRVTEVAEADLPPKLVLFVTDGAPNDRKQTVRLIKECASRPVFWQFIALGHKADYLRNLDTMDDRVIDNVGVVEWEDTVDMSDTEFFDAVITEFFTSWLPAARAQGITRC